jgi:hypothetical protein
MIIYDCEILRAISPEKDSERLDGIEYANGWRDFSNLGISVIGAYDYHEDRYRVFCIDNFTEFQKLVDSANIIVSFNGLAFDNRLCESNGITVPDEKSYDLLVEVWAAAGLGPKYQYPSHFGFGLDACVKANFINEAKSGHGAAAPIQWQRGQIGAVIDYCLQDVRLTKLLVDKIIREGYLNNPREKGMLTMRKPI